MNGFTGAAIGLAFVVQLAAVDALLAVQFLPASFTAHAQAAPHGVATQKRMQNPWGRSAARAAG